MEGRAESAQRWARWVLLGVLCLVVAIFVMPVHASAAQDGYYYPNYNESADGYIDLMRYMKSVTLTVNGQEYTRQELQELKDQGTPLTLKNTYTGDFITLYGVTEEQVRGLGHPYEAIRDAYRVSVPDTAAATGLIVRNPEVFRDYEITKGRMDDVFLAVTGKKLTGGAGK